MVVNLFHNPKIFKNVSCGMNFWDYKYLSISFLYIFILQMHALRRLMQGGPDHPKAPLGNNFRPPQQLYHRPVRTNIDFRGKQNGKICPSMYRDVHYKGK